MKNLNTLKRSFADDPSQGFHNALENPLLYGKTNREHNSKIKMALFKQSH